MQLPFRGLAAATLALALLPACAQGILHESFNFPVTPPAGDIPDTSLSTIFSELVAGSQIDLLTEVQVSLSLSGTTTGSGWAGDLFVSLNRDLGTHTAILLHQVGVTAMNPAGFSYDGWNVRFQDTAPNGDIHDAQPAVGDLLLTSTWQPDGRLLPTDTARPALLDQFNGLSGNGTWYLSITDLSPGGTMTLRNWSLELTGQSFTAVPEASAAPRYCGLLFAAAALYRRWSRRSSGANHPPASLARHERESEPLPLN